MQVIEVYFATAISDESELLLIEMCPKKLEHLGFCSTTYTVRTPIEEVVKIRDSSRLELDLEEKVWACLFKAWPITCYSYTDLYLGLRRARRNLLKHRTIMF